MAQSPTFKAFTTTAVTPVTAPPTTAAHFSVWNSAPAGGKSLYIQTLEAFTAASAGAAQIIQLFAHLGAGPQKRIGSGFTAASGPFSLGGPVVPSVATVGSAVTVVNDSVWHPCSLSETMGTGTTTIANGTFSNVNGLYVVAPGMVFSLAVLCSAAGTATCRCGVTWYEQ